MIQHLWQRIVAALDREEVRAFQGMYYVVFCVGGLMLLFVPGVDAAAGQVYLMLGATSYQMWAWLVVICPPITLVGRRLTTRSTGRSAGDANPAWGAAWLQFTGDFGVWCAVSIFAYELFRYDGQWWAHNLFLFLFLIMGVLGGFMFTVRSVRRLVGVKREVRSTQKAGS